MTPNERLRFLESELKKHDELYYGDCDPVISDSDYDKLRVELRDLIEQGVGESEYYRTPGHAQPMAGFAEIEHRYPMISLRTEIDTTITPIEKFIKRCLRDGYTGGYVAEPKYDGVALSLQYKDTELISAALRGNGERGENILLNAIHINNIPPSISDVMFSDSQIRGEVVLPKDNLAIANEWRVSQGKQPFANCRNAVSGILRSRKSGAKLLELLKFIPYTAYDTAGLSTQSTLLAELNNIFSAGASPTLFTSEELYSQYQRLATLRDSLSFDIDGIVFKVNDLAWQERLGSIDREPRWAIAHKFTPSEVTATLRDIDIEIGQSGRATPVARIQPVFVGGVIVSNVTLSNIFQIRKKGIRIGDTIVVRRAGDVIPEITGPSTENLRDHYVPNFSMKVDCPVCGTPLVRPKGQANYVCLGADCRAQLSGKFARIAQRDILDIEGLGSHVATLLVNDGVTKLSQLLELKEADFIKAGVGTANSVKLGKEIIRVRTEPISFDRAIRALSIPMIGEGASAKIAAVFDTPEKLLSNIDETIAIIQSMKSLNKTETANLIQYVRDNSDEARSVFYDLNIKTLEKASGLLSDMTVVFTGSDPSHSKDDLKRLAKAAGAVVGSSVSSSTSLVVYGAGAGEKLKKAGKLGIPTMSTQDFLLKYEPSKY